MRNLILPAFLLLSLQGFAAEPDTVNHAAHASILIVPYKPGMHLSDSDPHISEASMMNLQEMRSALRNDLIASLQKNFAEVHDVKQMKSDYVKDDSRDMEALYHSLLFESDSVYPLKNPKKFAVKDTVQGKSNKTIKKADTEYINVGINDQMLLADLSEKYEADFFIFLNELDIVTNYNDCMNFALKIYRRDLKVHYSIFDRHGRQLYGDVAVAHFDSNSNDVNEIADRNFPGIADYILKSFNRAAY